MNVTSAATGNRRQFSVPLHFPPAIAALVLAVLSPSALAATAEGTVFEDLNRNGALDSGEPGLEGVAVSNGRDVVLTDGEGRYRLDIDDEAIVFVTKPAGYATPVNAWQLPQFYYIHQPAGSPPGLRYRGVTPTGPLPESIDFPLYGAQEDRQFSALLFTDTQPQTEAEVDYIREDIVNDLVGTDAVFGMTLGDIVFDDMSLFPRLLSVIAQIGIPWYNVAGNHEINFLAADDRYSLETFKSYFGPPYYSFDYGEAHFVVLDNFEYQGNGESDPGDIRGNGGYIEKIGEKQLEWLKNDLKHVPAEKLVFLAMHGPLATYVDPEAPTLNTQDRRQLFRLLEGREHLYSVAGHTHTTEHLYFDEDDGFAGPGEFHHHVLTAVSGSWWSGPLDERGIPATDQRDGTPNGYHVLEVDGNSLQVSYRAAGKPATHQMNIWFDVAHHRHSPAAVRDFRPGELNDGRFNIDELHAADIVVNLFDGGPRSRVWFQVGGGEYQEMERRDMADPNIVESFERNKETMKPWVSSAPSSHIWVARMPGDLGPGTYTLTVEAHDEFGRSHHAHRGVEISGTSAAR